MKNILSFLVFVSFLTPFTTWAKEKHVFVTIAPLHSLVQGVMKGTGTAELLIKANISPHSFQIKPSQMHQLKTADLLFTISPKFEISMQKVISALKLQNRTISLIDADGVEVLKNRDGGAWGADEHEHEPESRDGHEVNVDSHIWLNPMNAIGMIGLIRIELTRKYPEDKAAFKANAEVMITRLETLDRIISHKLVSVKSRPFVVFHDAYQYFEKHYDLNAVGSIVMDPSKKPSISRMIEIRAQIVRTGAICAFREPQFSGKLIGVALDGSRAKSGILDPIGQDLIIGSGLYAQLLTQMAEQISSCLRTQ